MIKIWKLVDDRGMVRMEAAPMRAMGDEQFTWAHLLYGRLGNVKIGIFYFPSRFDTAVDRSVIQALHAFGQNSGASTSINIWDTKDPEFEQALELFGLKAIPGVVLATGLQVDGMHPRGPGNTPLYSIALTDAAVLSDGAQFEAAVNGAYRVLERSDPQEITGYIKAQTPNAILAAVGKIAASIRDEILKWKPKFGLPGGVSIQVG
jgi:hypothetical protein